MVTLTPIRARWRLYMRHRRHHRHHPRLSAAAKTAHVSYFGAAAFGWHGMHAVSAGFCLVLVVALILLGDGESET